jgi:phosphinothricin acetyltransferase
MIRPAHASDAPAIAEIYNHYVAHTVITFEEAAVTPEDMAGRIDRIVAGGLPWLVLESAGGIAGYAYASKWRERSAYRFSVETSIYLRHDATGKGHGRALYAQLLKALRALEVHAVIGGVALPNDASIRLHEALGFEKAAHFREVGRKFGRWVDVGYWETVLR